jgi:hypothetical protein
MGQDDATGSGQGRDDTGDPGAAERGRAPSVTRDGAVHGSGAGAGGGGTPEDFDADSAAGDAGNEQPAGPRHG